MKNGPACHLHDAAKDESALVGETFRSHPRVDRLTRAARVGRRAVEVPVVRRRNFLVFGAQAVAQPDIVKDVRGSKSNCEHDSRNM